MTRKSVDDPREPPGVVLSAATSVWLHVYPQRLFDFLRDERLRSEAMNSNETSSMLIQQETCTDALGSLVVYAPVDIPAMHVVVSGGDPAYVALLPSGFAILPDGPECRALALNPTGKGVGVNILHVGGSLLTVAFQILVNNLQLANSQTHSRTSGDSEQPHILYRVENQGSSTL
eukprot:PITA_13766